MNLEAAGPVVLRVTHVVEVVIPDFFVEMLYGIVCTNATTTGHVADRPVEKRDVHTVGRNDLELVHLRCEETLTPETASVPEEITGLVSATVNIGLKLNDPDSLRVASRMK